MHSETAAECGSLPAAPDKHPRIGSEVAKWPVLAGQFLLCSSIQLAWPSTTENVVQKVAGLGFCFYFVGDPDTRRGAEPGASRPRLGHSGHRLSVIHPHHTHILLTFRRNPSPPGPAPRKVKTRASFKSKRENSSSSTGAK